MFQRFENVQERLLRAGIAPRHVRRYLRELEDHFGDLVCEQTETGEDWHAAEIAARRRLGTDDALVAAVMARPELHSLVARHPWAAFVLVPVFALAAGVIAAVLLEHALITSAVTSNFSAATTNLLHPAWLKTSIAATNAAVNYALPLVIAAVVALLGTRQRVSRRVIAFGVVLACLVGAGHDVFVRWSDLLGHSEIDVGFIGPGYTKAMVLACAFRAVVSLALCGLVALFWNPLRSALHRQPAGT